LNAGGQPKELLGLLPHRKRDRIPARDWADALYLLVACAPDVAQHDIGLDGVGDRQGADQPIEAFLADQRLQRGCRVAKDVDPVTAPIGFLGKLSGALLRCVLQRQLQGGAQLGLIFLESRKGLDEELPDALAPVGRRRRKRVDRPEAVLDDCGDQLAAARKVAIGSRARHAGARGYLRHRRDLPITQQA